MDAADFISLAIRLSNSHNEADLRSAVSRGYYGAFHIAYQLLIDCGLRFPVKDAYAAEIHRKVRYCLSASENPDIVVVGSRLRLLRNQRNQADYDLGSTTLKSRETVAAMVRIARDIADTVERCRKEPEFFEARTRIRVYAHDVLRIQLVDT